MALFEVHKNSWPAETTQEQQDLCLGFGNLLLFFAKKAANEMGTGIFSNSGAHGLKAEQRFFLDKPHRFYRASVGSTVERAVYCSLTGEMSPKAGVYPKKTWFDSITVPAYALEYTDSTTELPCSFKKSRPDIRLSLGTGTDGKYYEALFDLTSEKQIGHVLDKGDNWLGKERVPFIAEVVWTDDDIMLK